MQNEAIFPHIDHTLLKPDCTWEQIQKLCDEAIRFHTASVCVPPAYIERIREKYGDTLTICTVIGFPLGYATAQAKAFEAVDAVSLGADEVDMVINLGDVKNGCFDKVTAEIALVRKAVGEKVLKVIIETCCLTQEEKIRLCACVTKAKADYIKTSTGFGSAGAKLEDIELFKQHIGKNVKIKAAGGIKTKQDLEAFLNAGCDRIGTSSAVALLSGGEAGGY
ncbi:deoxyribose-phosphate aldolase [Acetanaerobacterium elongatum]|uniref:Deoxyribose-phosphate aldolase n=1 Tax=Acetanaerobacterium elongatum TaxID=258515 RepID=A0A1G9XEB1_9FIRM|nr:deoxyribose-phosphate aldolase [Acetanaerobacterium elongatum]SDM95068.1 deoxyribose-phosphate aldolase [Acetanaerobacterium elongatum]